MPPSFNPDSRQPSSDDAQSCQEVADVFCQWKARTFAKGPISRGRVESATADLLSSLSLPNYRRWFLQDRRCAVKDAPGDDWWDGLKAISEMLARQLSVRIGAGLPDDVGVNFDGWVRMFYANSRGTFGPGVPHHPIPSGWSEDRPFIDAWARALEMIIDGDPKNHARWALARLWDTFLIPLRYWTDTAALELLNKCLAVERRDPFELDTYRKDIRGKRGGLSLNPPVDRKAVVSLRTRGPQAFRVHRKRACQYRLCLTHFPTSFPLADGTRLEFVFEG